MNTETIENNPFQSVMIRDIKNDERPREKAMNQGIKSLDTAELLALLFGGGMPGLSVVNMSKGILASVNHSLLKLAKMEIKEMTRLFRGIGPAKAVTLAAAFELGVRLRRELDDELRTQSLQVRSSIDAYNYIRGDLETLDYEQFWVLMLSRSNRIKAKVCISQGGVSGTIVDQKLVFRRALDHLASSIVLVHNHPSESLQPSGPDDELTRKLVGAGKLLDIAVIDHLIITATGYFSYADQGRMPH